MRGRKLAQSIQRHPKNPPRNLVANNLRGPMAGRTPSHERNGMMGVRNQQLMRP